MVSFTTLLKGLCEAGDMDGAQEVTAWRSLYRCLEALKEMLAAGEKPNIRTANTLLRGYRRAGEVQAASELWRPGAREVCQSYALEADGRVGCSPRRASSYVLSADSRGHQQRVSGGSSLSGLSCEDRAEASQEVGF